MDIFKDSLVFGGSKALLFNYDSGTQKYSKLCRIVDSNIMLGYLTNIRFWKDDILVVNTKQAGCFLVTLQSPIQRIKLYDTQDNVPWVDNFDFNQSKTWVLGKVNKKKLAYAKLDPREVHKPKFFKLKRDCIYHIQSVRNIKDDVFFVSLGCELLIIEGGQALKKVKFMIEKKVLVVRVKLTIEGLLQHDRFHKS